MPCSLPGPTNPNWGGSNIKYRGAHMRVWRARGKADQYTCECGAQAQQWAYDNTDPDEKVGTSNGVTVLYSTNPDRYAPLCIPCHRTHDARRR